MSKSTCRSIAITTAALALLIAGSRSLATEPTEIWREIEGSTLDPAGAVLIENVQVDMAMGLLHFDDGVLIPAHAIEGQTAELVFVGEGRFSITAPDRLESAQLELFTNQRALDVAIDRVVFAVGDATVVAGLLGRDAAAELTTDVIESATAVYDEWVAGAERPGFGADVAILGARLGDVDAGAFFAAWMRSEELGDFYYRFDPGESEQVTLGQFVAIEADFREENQIRRAIKRGQRRGRYGQLRFEDLGDWDTWISTPLRSSSGAVARGSRGIEAKRYTLDVQIRPDDESVRGSARLQLIADKAGKQVANLSLNSDLVIDGVEDSAGEPLAWVRSGNDVYVVLPAPTEQGQTVEIHLRYGGKVLSELIKGKTYALVDTYSWYPRAGEVDRATYDVTLRWPKRLELLASGRRIDGGEESGLRWERRTLDTPAIAFSFEIGDYEIRTATVGHVELTVGFSKTGTALDKGVKDEVMTTLADALAFFEKTFGPYPLDHLTVATVPRGFSQGFLGFLTLSHYVVGLRGSWGVFDSSFEDYSQYRKENRTETLAHELSHQWWGNMVGWASYRDQWLSEALASFSSTLFMTATAERKAVYRARRGKSVRGSLNRGTLTGRSIESLGPVVMGSRLNSSAGSAYTAVVYDKGSVVFTMLASMMGEDQFAEMLGVLSARVNHRVIDTATFIKAIEKMSGYDLTTFADQFIYGIGIPEVYYSFEFERQTDGTWIIQGKARQVSARHFTYKLERTADGTWFVAQQRTADKRTHYSAFVVPFQVALASGKDVVTKGHAAGIKTTTEKGLGGKLLVRDEVSEFNINIKQEPRDFWLDQRGDVLARFYSEKHQPKKMLRWQAVELAGDGRFDEAEAMFQRSIGAPLIPEDELADTDLSKKEIERRSWMEECLAYLGLARVYLAQQRDTAARDALAAGEALLKGLDKDRYMSLRQKIQCHLDLRTGNYDAAYDVLSKWIRLDIPVREGESIGAGMRRNKFSSRGRRWGDGLDYSMLAVAAFETGHEEVAREAIREAKERGSDLGTLEELMRGG